MYQKVKVNQIKKIYAVHSLPLPSFWKFELMKKRGWLRDYENVIKCFKRGDDYILLSNRLGYEIAKLSEQEYVAVNVVDVDSRSEYFETLDNLPDVTIPTCRIKITDEFRKKRIKPHKMSKAQKYLNEFNKLDKNIEVELFKNKNGKVVPVLRDGYSRRCVAKRNKLHYVPCDVINVNAEISELGDLETALRGEE